MSTHVCGAYTVLWTSFDFGSFFDSRVLGFERLLDLGHYRALSAIEFGPRLIGSLKGRIKWPFTL